MRENRDVQVDPLGVFGPAGTDAARKGIETRHESSSTEDAPFHNRLSEATERAHPLRQSSDFDAIVQNPTGGQSGERKIEDERGAVAAGIGGESHQRNDLADAVKEALGQLTDHSGGDPPAANSAVAPRGDGLASNLVSGNQPGSAMPWPWTDPGSAILSTEVASPSNTGGIASRVTAIEGEAAGPLEGPVIRPRFTAEATDGFVRSESRSAAASIGTQVAATQVGATQLGATQVAATQVGATQVAEAQVAATQAAATQVDAKQVAATQVDATGRSESIAKTPLPPNPNPSQVPVADAHSSSNSTTRPGGTASTTLSSTPNQSPHLPQSGNVPMLPVDPSREPSQTHPAGEVRTSEEGEAQRVSSVQDRGPRASAPVGRENLASQSGQAHQAHPPVGSRLEARAEHGLDSERVSKLDAAIVDKATNTRSSESPADPKPITRHSNRSASSSEPSVVRPDELVPGRAARAGSGDPADPSMSRSPTMSSGSSPAPGRQAPSNGSSNGSEGESSGARTQLFPQNLDTARSASPAHDGGKSIESFLATTQAERATNEVPSQSATSAPNTAATTTQNSAENEFVSAAPRFIGENAVETTSSSEARVYRPLTESTTQTLPQDLHRTVRMTLEQGGREAVLRMRPAELGPIKIELGVDGNQISVKIAAVRPEIQTLIDNSRPQLMRTLERAGFVLEQMAVERSESVVSPQSTDLLHSDTDRGAQNRGGDNTGRFEEPGANPDRNSRRRSEEGSENPSPIEPQASTESRTTEDESRSHRGAVDRRA